MNKIVNAKSFSFIVYMSPDKYDVNTNKNMDIHIPLHKKILFNRLIYDLYRKNILRNIIIEYLLIGHEHGKELRKCHYHIYIKLEKKINRHINPDSFIFEGITYLYMCQTSKTPGKLINYIKKENDYIEEYIEKNISDILREENLIQNIEDLKDPYDYLLNNNNLNTEQIVKIFSTSSITDYKKDFITNSKKIIDTYETYVFKKNEDVPDFSWRFPSHMIDYLNTNNIDTDKYRIFKMIYDWYNKYCIIEQNVVKRRKSLFLFSLKGGVGKSYFARSLVPEIDIGNSPYYIYCRGTLDAQEFKRKKLARLVILDDVCYTDKDIEIWKALAVSEPTNIRTPYYNFPWNKSLPCILLSNNYNTLKYWSQTDDLKTRCIFVSVNFYIGPPDTDVEENHRFDAYFTDDVNNKLRNNNFNILKFFKK